MTVMSLDGARLLDGAESARQRLGDALRIRRGTYPWLRDYGSRLADLVDRRIDRQFEALVYAGVAETIAHPPNGLADVRLREVRLAPEGDRVGIEVFADWIAPDGAIGQFGLRQDLARPEPAAGMLWTAAPDGLYEIDPETGAASRRPGPANFGLDAPAAPAALAFDGRAAWMATRGPGRLYRIARADGAAELVPGPDDYGVGESRPDAMAWASYRLLMLGDDVDALLELDRATGIARRVHDIDRFGIGEHQPDGLAWDGWRLWMVGGINHALHRIDPRAGRAVRTGGSHRFGQDLDGGGELAWAAHRLLMLRFDAPPMLYELDRVTGAAAPLLEVTGLPAGAAGLVWVP